MPRLSAQSGVPTSRAGMPTARAASLSTIDRPVQLALPDSMDSLGLWFADFRCVEYPSFSFLNSSLFSFCTASVGVLQSFTMGMHSS